MSASDSRPTRRDFFSVAQELTMLRPEELAELSAESTRRQTHPGNLALQKGLLDAAQIDIIQTLLNPTETVPGYEILSVLGRGGMGVVYRAQQLNLKRTVALKTVLVHQLGQHAVLKRFEQEAQAVARLAHPHIVAAYDFGRHEGRLYFAMELVTGEDVAGMIRRRGPLDEWTTWALVRQAAAGLAHAAQHGIVHRDIKPANLLLVEPPTGFSLPAGVPMVKIADFGLAQWAAADEHTRLTAPNAAVGSPNYMAPEQLLGNSTDLRTDIFALGASAFHMLTGKPPHAGKAVSQIMAQRLNGQIESIRELRPHISQASIDLVTAMMAHEMRDRPSDYRELTRRIDALATVSPANVATVAFAPRESPALPPDAQMVTGQLEQGGRGKPRLARSSWLAIGACALGAMAVLVATFSRGPDVGVRDLRPSGRIEELFDGQNISQWKPITGGWSQAKDNEGALVLSGRGLVRRPIVSRNAAGASLSLAHYRLTMAVDLHEAAQAEVQFDLAADRSDASCLFARITRDGCAMGTRGGPDGSTVTVAAGRALASGGAALHAIDIERQSGGWWVMVDGQLMGALPFLHATPADEFRLLAEGGPAWFSDFTLEELEPAAP